MWTNEGEERENNDVRRREAKAKRAEELLYREQVRGKRGSGVTG